eukprot:9467678-Pyramimonas_sp.AAC.1
MAGPPELGRGTGSGGIDPHRRRIGATRPWSTMFPGRPRGREDNRASRVAIWVRAVAFPQRGGTRAQG